MKKEREESEVAILLGPIGHVQQNARGHLELVLLGKVSPKIRKTVQDCVESINERLARRLPMVDSEGRKRVFSGKVDDDTLKHLQSVIEQVTDGELSILFIPSRVEEGLRSIDSTRQLTDRSDPDTDTEGLRSF